MPSPVGGAADPKPKYRRNAKNSLLRSRPHHSANLTSPKDRGIVKTRRWLQTAAAALLRLNHEGGLSADGLLLNNQPGQLKPRRLRGHNDRGSYLDVTV
jgi:hypothetical protein